MSTPEMPDLYRATDILFVNRDAHYMRREDDWEYADSQEEADSCDAAIRILEAVEYGGLDVSHLFPEGWNE